MHTIDEEAPAWLRGGDNNSGGNSTRGGNQTVIVKVQGPEDPWKGTFEKAAFIFNSGLSVMVAATGALAIAEATGVSAVASVFLGLYMITFGGLYCIFEFLQMCKIVKFDDMLKRNFGFLYGYIGKTFYMFFVGILAFGLEAPKWATATGSMMCVWAAIHGILYFWRPTLFTLKEKYNPLLD